VFEIFWSVFSLESLSGLVVGKTMSLAMSGAHTLLANITIGRKGLPGTNNLAI
jgi:hypothetical protein